MSPLSSLGLFELDVVALDALRRLDISTTNHFVALAHTIPSPPHPLAPPPQAVCAILENLKHRVVSNPCTGLELCKDMEANPSFYSLGCSRLDQMLAGGVRVGEVLELAGPSSSGKTQICMSAVAAVAARGGQAFFLDTAQAFSARRLHDMLAYMLPRSQAESAMARVRALRLHSADSLQAALHALHQELAAHRGDAGTLVVVDSVAACLAPLLGGQHLHQHRQGHVVMEQVAAALRRLAHRLPTAVIITNHAVAGADRQSRPALGATWRCQPDVRMLLSHSSSAREGGGGEHCANVVSGRPPSQVLFRITHAGVVA